MIATRITADGILHRWQAGSKDEAGDVTATFAEGVPVKVELQQQPGELGATEKRDNQLVATSRWLAFLRPDVAVSHLDEFTIAGIRYSVDGEPWVVRHPRTGRSLHVQAKLRRVT